MSVLFTHCIVQILGHQTVGGGFQYSNSVVSFNDWILIHKWSAVRGYLLLLSVFMIGYWSISGQQLEKAYICTYYSCLWCGSRIRLHFPGESNRCRNGVLSYGSVVQKLRRDTWLWLWAGRRGCSLPSTTASTATWTPSSISCSSTLTSSSFLTRQTQNPCERYKVFWLKT